MYCPMPNQVLTARHPAELGPSLKPRTVSVGRMETMKLLCILILGWKLAVCRIGRL